MESRCKRAADGVRRRQADRRERSCQGAAAGLDLDLPQDRNLGIFRRGNIAEPGGEFLGGGRRVAKGSGGVRQRLPHFRTSVPRGYYRSAVRASGAADALYGTEPTDACQTPASAGHRRPLSRARRRMERKPGRRHAIGSGACGGSDASGRDTARARRRAASFGADTRTPASAASARFASFSANERLTQVRGLNKPYTCSGLIGPLSVQTWSVAPNCIAGVIPERFMDALAGEGK